ncbi:MAG TPA: hypothetical protein VGN96_01170 [Roseococcus sp.]|jgi:hypothetical protein|nr:hypothetical protein [Roseococcus sp.]
MTMQQTVDALRAQATGRAHWLAERHPYRCRRAVAWHERAAGYSNAADLFPAGSCAARTIGARADALAEVAQLRAFAWAAVAEGRVEEAVSYRRQAQAVRRRASIEASVWRRGA